MYVCSIVVMQTVHSRYSIFKESYQKVWARCLPFRKASEFPECDTCYELKEGMRLTRVVWQNSVEVFQCGLQDSQETSFHHHQWNQGCHYKDAAVAKLPPAYY